MQQVFEVRHRRKGHSTLTANPHSNNSYIHTVFFYFWFICTFFVDCFLFVFFFLQPRFVLSLPKSKATLP